jgi:hypothetical protein
MFLIASKNGTVALEAIYSSGDWRLLGSIPTPKSIRSLFTPFAAANPVIPRSQWKVVSRPRTEVPILDQNGRGACVGHGATSALMLARSISGQQFQLLSAPFTYALINGGSDNGAAPGDAAQTLQTQGVCLMTEFPEPLYKADQIPASARLTAKRFMASEVYPCANWEERMSAFFLGFSVFETIMVGGSFNSLSSEGVPPVAFGPGNHCISGGDATVALSNGDICPIDRNSWSPGWGMTGQWAGCFVMTEAHALRQGSNYEAWAVKSTLDDPQDPTNPPLRS